MFRLSRIFPVFGKKKSPNKHSTSGKRVTGTRDSPATGATADQLAMDTPHPGIEEAKKRWEPDVIYLKERDKQDLNFILADFRNRPVIEPDPLLMSRRRETLLKVHKCVNQPTYTNLANHITHHCRPKEPDQDACLQLMWANHQLATLILDLINHAEFFPGKTFSNLEEAVIQLGPQKAQLALFYVKGMILTQKIRTSFDWRPLWSHLLGTSLLCDHITRALNYVTTPSVPAAAFIHDIGKVILSEIYPDDYRMVLQNAWDNQSACSLEELQIFGITHAEAGHAFARSHGLPAVLQKSVECHENPEKAAASDAVRSAAIIQLANYYSKMAGTGFSGDCQYLKQSEKKLSAWTLLGIQGPSTPAQQPVQSPEERLKAAVAGKMNSIRNIVALFFDPSRIMTD